MTNSPSITASDASSAATNAGRASAVAVATLLGVTLLGGTAAAYWTTTGTGTGSATAGDAVELETEDAAASGELFPGMSVPAAGAVTVTNGNSFDVKVLEIDFEAADADKTGCDGTGGVTFADSTTLTIVIEAGESAEVPYTVSMDTTSPNECQGAVFTAAYEIKAVSQ